MQGVSRQARRPGVRFAPGRHTDQLDTSVFGSLPFLKQKRIPRVATESPDEKLINGDPDDYLEEHCTSELMDAFKARDPKLFRQALEALVMNCFEFGESDG